MLRGRLRKHVFRCRPRPLTTRFLRRPRLILMLFSSMHQTHGVKAKWNESLVDEGEPGNEMGWSGVRLDVDRDVQACAEWK
jgi:hypothetical protein